MGEKFESKIQYSLFKGVATAVTRLVTRPEQMALYMVKLHSKFQGHGQRFFSRPYPHSGYWGCLLYLTHASNMSEKKTSCGDSCKNASVFDFFDCNNE